MVLVLTKMVGLIPLLLAVPLMAQLGLKDLSLRVTAAFLHVSSNPVKHPRLRLMLKDLSDVMQLCEKDLGLYEQG